MRQLVREDGSTRSARGRLWIEGEHLCRAAWARNLRPACVVLAQSACGSVPAPWRQAGIRVVVLADALFARLSPLPSPAGMGFVLDWPASRNVLRPGLPAVVLDRVQDAGNVGTIVRSAACMGFAQVLALKGTALLWSGKVLRAGMGAHFGLHLVEGLEAQDIIQTLQLPLLATDPHGGAWLHRAALPWPCAWMLGHEGRGLDAALMQAATQRVRIHQPGGEESLNVAAAAAICLHASAAQRTDVP